MKRLKLPLDLKGNSCYGELPSQTIMVYKAELSAAVDGGDVISKTPESWSKHSISCAGQVLAHARPPSRGVAPTWPGVFPVCHSAFRRCSPGPVVEFTTLTERPEYP